MTHACALCHFKFSQENLVTKVNGDYYHPYCARKVPREYPAGYTAPFLFLLPPIWLLRFGCLLWFGC